MAVPARARTRPVIPLTAPDAAAARASRDRVPTKVDVETRGGVEAAAIALAAAEQDPSFPPAPPRRPRLRVVDEAARRAQLARQRRARVLVAMVVMVVVGSVLALAAAHAYLVSGQGELDRLTVQVEQARAQYSEARLAVAQLDSPERIVTEAVNRLGMVTPTAVQYLAPSSQLAAQVGAVASDTGSDAVEASAPWPAVKPYLGAAR